MGGYFFCPYFFCDCGGPYFTLPSMKKYGREILLAFILVLVAYRAVVPHGLSREERKEYRQLLEKNLALEAQVQELRLEKSEVYDSIIKIVKQGQAIDEELEKINGKHEKIRSTPISNRVGDSLARAILTLQGQH